MTPYREVAGEKRVGGHRARAAAADRARANVRAWRRALTVVAALLGVGAYAEARWLAGLQLAAVLFAGVCALEEWRLARAVRRLLETEADPVR